MSMRPAFIAFALAIGLFALVKFQPPLLYVTLLFPLAIFIYGLVAPELPSPPEPDDAGSGDPEDQDDGSK